MKKLLLSTFAMLLLLTSCSGLKTFKLMKSGEVEQEEFKVNIPFEYNLGMIILKVNISGEEYDFLLDTGAPNVISKELAQKYGLSNIFERKFGDSQGQTSDLGMIKLDEISIGGINFLNTGAAIADLKQSKELGCLKIDGLIGSNLMRKAVWKFDYENQIITISNSVASLKISESSEKIPFFTYITGTPIIDITLNDVKEKNVIVDLGSNGDISLSKKTFDKLVDTDPNISRTVSFGSSSSGLYGVGAKDSVHHALISNISFGDVALKNTVVKFSNEALGTIGINYFKNYDLIINWFDKEIIVTKKKEYDNSSLTSYGFSFNNKNDRLIV
ncbi:MAG: retropepsin-like aspartic protease, partial [Polaribacter sp.]|uniref:retropepsin-like aspartic protease n=1 Tax=Polaribacter sp. TaxID=1920175 RepID=UPI00384EDA15